LKIKLKIKLIGTVSKVWASAELSDETLFWSALMRLPVVHVDCGTWTNDRRLLVDTVACIAPRIHDPMQKQACVKYFVFYYNITLYDW